MESGLEVRQAPDCSIPELHVPETHKELYLEPPATSDGRALYSPAPTDNKLSAQYDLSEAPPPPRKRGISRWLSGVIVALITAVVVGAALGGGLGSQLAAVNQRAEHCNVGSSSTQAPETTSTTPLSSAGAAGAATTTTGGLYVDYAAPTQSAVTNVALDCPNLDGRTYLTLRQQTFNLSCSKNLVGGDMICIVAYHYSDCIEACSSMNAFAGSSTLCTAVNFAANMANTTGLAQGGNCWLKGTGSGDISVSSTASKNGASATWASGNVDAS